MAQLESKFKELESKSAARDDIMTQLQQDIKQKSAEISNAKVEKRNLEQDKKKLVDQLETTDRKLKTLTGFLILFLLTP